jgi:DMSO/TMAO reductase YedYZ heme-binding membrane subunit
MIGSLPVVAVVGFITYGLFLVTALAVSIRPIRRRLGRRGLRVHRWLAALAFLLGTFHLLLGLSAYV